MTEKIRQNARIHVIDGFFHAYTVYGNALICNIKEVSQNFP
jgi:hypothetical protein